MVIFFFSTEIEKFQKGEGKDEEKYIDVVINKNMKLGQKVLIPVKQFPKVRQPGLCLITQEEVLNLYFGDHFLKVLCLSTAPTPTHRLLKLIKSLFNDSVFSI